MYNCCFLWSWSHRFSTLLLFCLWMCCMAFRIVLQANIFQSNWHQKFIISIVCFIYQCSKEFVSSSFLTLLQTVWFRSFAFCFCGWLIRLNSLFKSILDIISLNELICIVIEFVWWLSANILLIRRRKRKPIERRSTQIIWCLSNQFIIM